MKKPWQIHPSLTAERLTIVAEILANVRSDAVLEHRSNKGDTSWGLGCRVYERSLFALDETIDSGKHPWLTLVEKSGLHYVFAIGGVPIRFYHGDHEDPADPRRLRRRQPELYAQQNAFEFVPEPVMEPVLRVVVETDSEGQADSIFLVQLDEEAEVHNPWPIPFQKTAIVLNEFLKAGVELPPPVVGEQPPALAAENEGTESEAQKAQ
jgi:hypothetical protein